MAKSKDGTRFLRYFGPLLEALRELGGSGTPDEVVERIATDLKLPDDLQNELLPSGDLRFRKHVAFARLYLAWEGYIDSSERGVWSLTEQGRTKHLSLDESHEILAKWGRILRERRKPQVTDGDGIADKVLDLNGYSQQVLEIRQDLPPAGFEQLCQAILREAGFIEVSVTGRSGDQGIDGHGTLQINPLVSFRVLFQCKRYKDSVSASHIRDFRGAMGGRADKGIIITTGTFTARRESSRDGVPPIELIDGDKLVGMLEALSWGCYRKIFMNYALYKANTAGCDGLAREAGNYLDFERPVLRRGMALH